MILVFNENDVASE